jgi:hypothetical protein
MGTFPLQLTMKKTWRSTGARAALILLLTIVAYIPAMHAGFIWDDDDHLTTNPAMSAPHGLRMIWSSLAVSRYYPLTLTNFWFQHRLWGLNPLPYHEVNVTIHAIFISCYVACGFPWRGGRRRCGRCTR